MALIGSGSGPGPLKPDANKNAVPNTVFAIAVAAPLFQNTVIPDDGFSYIVPTDHLYMLFDLSTIEGDLTLNGDLILLG